MKVSEMLKQPEWEYIFDKCITAKVNPKLIVAIGWHETHWGRLGMGKHGYFLGVSCWKRTQLQYRRDKAKGIIDEETRSGTLYCLLPYKGIDGQVGWAIEKFSGRIPFNPTYEDVLKIAYEIWKPGNPQAWAKSVYSIYKNLEVDYQPNYILKPLPEGPDTIPTQNGELADGAGPIQRIIYYLEQIIKILKAWR